MHSWTRDREKARRDSQSLWLPRLHSLHLAHSHMHPSIHPPFFLCNASVIQNPSTRFSLLSLHPSAAKRSSLPPPLRICSDLLSFNVDQTFKMSSTPYKGSLKQKRKAELSEIAQALGIGLDHSQKKEELEDLIREHLISHKNQYASDENFKGLIDSLDSGRRRSARSSSVNGNA